MRKAPLVFLLVLSLLWHSFAMANGAWAYAHGDDLAHAVMHLDNEPHHHHDDGSYHHDDSDESLKHVYTDGCANAAGVLPACSASVLGDARTLEKFSPAPPAHDSPILEGPRRPPRLAA
jgi:hypothetical protein